MKKTLIFLLITALVFALAACGNKAAETESGGTTSITRPETGTTRQKTYHTTADEEQETTKIELEYEYEYSFDEALGGLILTKYLGDSAKVKVPAEIDGKPVVVLEGTFEHNPTIVEVSIPEGVKVIGLWTFSTCEALVSVKLPESLTSIKQYAFENCKALTDITLPAGLKEMEGCLFRECISLTSIAIPAGITELPGTIFQGCLALREVTLPDGLLEIGSSAFFNCMELSNFVLPDSVMYIDRYAFSGCVNLFKIVIPDGITAVGRPTGPRNGRFGGAFDHIPNFTAIYKGVAYKSANRQGDSPDTPEAYYDYYLPEAFYNAVNKPFMIILGK